MRTIDVPERRARLAERHFLLPGRRAPDMVAAAEGMVGLHATEAATVYLSTWARVDGVSLADIDEALYVERSVVKHLAMRRTLWAFPRESLDGVQSGVSARLAASQRRSMAGVVERAGLADDGEHWVAEASREVLHALADGREATAMELRDEIALLRGAITYSAGAAYGGEFPVGPPLLATMSAAGEVVRATNNGPWTVPRPRWTTMRSWLGRDLVVGEEAPAFTELVRRWLRAFGPGTERDVKWWFGSTLGAVRRALEELGAVPVDLVEPSGDRSTGFVLPDDVEPVEPAEPWVALLPSLDATTMGWQSREWYLGEYGPLLFDRNGNAGATAWHDGRIVGSWHQTDSGEVVVDLLERLGAEAVRMLEEQAGRLTAWVGGARIPHRFTSPQVRERADRFRPGSTT